MISLIITIIEIIPATVSPDVISIVVIIVYARYVKHTIKIIKANPLNISILNIKPHLIVFRATPFTFSKLLMPPNPSNPMTKLISAELSISGGEDASRGM